jgi:hypothetical protein
LDHGRAAGGEIPETLLETPAEADPAPVNPAAFTEIDAPNAGAIFENVQIIVKDAS